MRLRWMRGRAKRNIFATKWKAAEANLGHYPAKAQKPTRHRKMRPICACQRSQSSAAMQGCVNILGGIAAIRQPAAKPAWLASMPRFYASS